jgi:hypothetical protein
VDIFLLDSAIAVDQIPLMAEPRKQTRRSISVRGTTYENLRRYCEEHDRSMSDLVEEQLAALFAGKKPTGRTVAPKVVRARESVGDSVGRPAPRPARELVPERVRAPRGDYRVISF